MFGITKTKSVLAMPSDLWACGQYRIIQPYTDMALRYNFMTKFDFKLYLPQAKEHVNIDIVNPFDAIVVQRCITEEMLHFIEELKRRKKIVILEVDDDLYNIDTNNPFHQSMKGIKYKEHFKQSLKMVDFIHTTTPEIKNSLVNLTKVKEEKVKIFPNVIDLSHPLLNENMRQRHLLPKENVVFGWQGGSSHTIDLKYLNFFSKILDDNPKAVFAFCSHPNLFDKFFKPFVQQYKDRIVFVNPITTKFDDFPNVPSVFDIGLAPLKENRFNDCKSWLKCLEYGVWSVPTICSPNPDYRRFNELQNTPDLIIENNDYNGWINKTNELIQNDELRIELGKKARNTIETL